MIKPHTITSINNYAFLGWSALTSVVIPNSVTSIGYLAFLGCSSLNLVILGKGVKEIGSVFYGCTNLKEMILSQTAFDNGIPACVTKFTTYSKSPMRVVVTSKGATSAKMNIYPIDDRGNTDEDNYYTVIMHGLTAGQNIKWKLDDENYGIISEKAEALTMEVQPAQAMSTTKARLSATISETDDYQHFGFEWLRYDAPDIMTPYRISAPLYNGQIIGTLSGLNPDKYYKYRPYYKSDDGSMSYGEWEAFLTGDANVFFEAETHTKEVTNVTSVSAQLAGVWIEGTEDVEEKGFEYWLVTESTTRTAGGDVKKVIVSGNQTTITLNSLISGIEYGYRSYIKTASGITYGEEKTFKTISDGKLRGDVNGDGVVSYSDVVAVLNRILCGNSDNKFVEAAADVNNDGQITIADALGIVDIIR